MSTARESVPARRESLPWVAALGAFAAPMLLSWVGLLMVVAALVGYLVRDSRKSLSWRFGMMLVGLALVSWLLRTGLLEAASVKMLDVKPTPTPG